MQTTNPKTNNKGLKRASNFTSEEEMLLTTLAKKYAKQIECKETDHDNNKMKAQAWVKIWNEFNSKAKVFRDIDSLKNKFKNIKTRSKKKFAEHKKYLYGTGGGPHKPYEGTEVDKQIREIIGTQRLEGINGEYDDDFIENGSKASGDESIEELPLSDEVIVENLDIVMVTDDGAQSEVSVEKSEDLVNDWSSYSPAMLRRQVSGPLRTYCVDENNLQLGLQVDHDYSLICEDNNPTTSKSGSLPLSPSTPTSMHCTPSKTMSTYRIGKRKHQDLEHFSVVGDSKSDLGSSSKDDSTMLLNKCNDSEQKSAPTKRTNIKSGITPLSPKRVKNLSVLRGKMGKWTASKIELATLQKQCFLEAHKQKMLHMERKHEQFMAFAKEEFDLKKKQMIEEHQAKMAVLSSKGSDINSK